MTLLSYSPQARRIALSIKRIEGYRNFANKLWNAARYVLGALSVNPSPKSSEVQEPRSDISREPQALPNRWILSRLAHALDAANAGLDSYRLDDASGALYHFVWDEFCDWYLELSKPLLQSDDTALRDETHATLAHVLETMLRALHPMMPFITEEIWQRVPKNARESDVPTIMQARYPSAELDARPDAAAEDRFAIVQQFIVSVRTIRAEHDLPRRERVTVHFQAEAEPAAVLENERALIEALAGCALVRENENKLANPTQHFDRAAVFANPGVQAVVPGVIDIDKERDRLRRALQKLEKELTAVEKKLANPNFVERAPAEVVEKSRRDAAELRAKQTQMQAGLAPDR